MSGIALADGLALMAIVRGLRKGGEVSEVTIQAIAHELRAATSISDEWGHKDTTKCLLALADTVERADDAPTHPLR